MKLSSTANRGARRERQQFYELLRRRGKPVFYAFDCLMVDGKDLRFLPLIERKRILRRVVKSTRELSTPNTLSEASANSLGLFREQNLEGIVAKRRDAPYGEQWIKIRNPNYSHYEGRQELFEKWTKTRTGAEACPERVG